MVAAFPYHVAGLFITKQLADDLVLDATAFIASRNEVLKRQEEEREEERPQGLMSDELHPR